MSYNILELVDLSNYLSFSNSKIVLNIMPLEGLNPDSLWAGPPAWELGTLSLDLQPPGGVFSLLIFFISFFNFMPAGQSPDARSRLG